MSAQLLVDLLRESAQPTSLDMRQWVSVITIARAEQLLGTLACKLEGMELPDEIEAAMADARLNVEYQHRTAMWEADCARRALADYDGKVVLMKGTAYVAAGLSAGEGRYIGDLDIMVAEDDLPEVERLLFEEGGWEWVKEDAYDDAYYREHMHELPPMIHKERDRMIDVHHTILPKTARPKPDAKRMLERSIALPNGYTVFHPFDRLIHCAAHLIADGDLTGGLRNLWDFHCLFEDFFSRGDVHSDSEDGKLGYDEWPDDVFEQAEKFGLGPNFQRARRLSKGLFGDAQGKLTISDRFYIRRLLARDDWGRGKYPITRLAFYIRSHWLRMPPLMLARHLWTKWRKA